MSSKLADLSPLARKLGAEAPLTEAQVAAILALPATVRQVDAGQDIVREGDMPSQACLLLDGLAARFKIAADGARQIHSFHISGDIPDLQSLQLARMDHSVSALRPSTLALLPHYGLKDLIRAHPELGYLLWRETLIEGSIFREWMSNIGRRQALERVAHVLCELAVRFDVLGLLYDGVLPVRIPQVDIGDAQGLSVVHVNRVMKQLKAQRLVRMKGPLIQILDFKALADVGDFDPAYLHLHTLPEICTQRAA